MGDNGPWGPTVSVATLLLGDSRFPAGGHAHSGGVEPAVTAGTVTDLESLEWFLRGRLRTAGLVAAGLAAAGICLAYSVYGWAALFLILGGLNLAGGSWYVAIARSATHHP